MPAMTITIVIRTKNEGAGIGVLLDRVRSQKTDLPVRVVVVDSGSTDNTLAIVRRHEAEIIEIPASQFSYGHSLNLGIRHARGEVICSVSAHCVPADDWWLHELISPIVLGAAHATYGRQVPVRGVNPFEEVSLQKHFPEEGRSGGRVPFSNANCAFRRGMWEELPFDEEIPSWEDYLWYRLLKERYTFLYCPRAVVSHSHPFSLSRIRRIAYNDGRAFRIFRERYGIDLVKGDGDLGGSKVVWVLKDIWRYGKYFARGYRRQIPLVPFARALAYTSYWRGYTAESDHEAGPQEG